MKQSIIKNKAVSYLILAILAAFIAGCQTSPDKQQIGAVAGGVLGGVLGSNIGEGKGKTAAIIAGTMAGAMLGGTIGQYMDETDQIKMQHALEQNRTNQVSAWHNQNTGRDVSVTPMRTYKNADGLDCREYTTTINIDGRQQTATGTACRAADGSWKVTG